MQFSATWQLVLSGQKTQTRRIAGLEDDYLVSADHPPEWQEFYEDGHLMVSFPANQIHRCPISAVIVNGRMKWMVGRTYAVQPGRGQKAVGRIRITAIRQERVRSITEADAKAEGVAWYMPSPEGWAVRSQNSPVAKYSALWDRIHDKPGERWADNPLVWVLEFELVEGGA